MDQATYVTRVLHLYRKVPGTLDRVLRDDRRTALDLYHRNVPIEIVENAFILVAARRAKRATDDPDDPIRVLRYILPVIQELILAPPQTGYLHYIECRLREEFLFTID